jgi:hypothetical protein
LAFLAAETSATHAVVCPTTLGLETGARHAALSRFQQSATLAAEAGLHSEGGFLRVHKRELLADRQIQASSASSHPSTVGALLTSAR